MEAVHRYPIHPLMWLLIDSGYFGRKETLKRLPDLAKPVDFTRPGFPMKQMTFADAEYAGKRKQTRRELFLIEMDQVVRGRA